METVQLYLYFWLVQLVYLVIPTALVFWFTKKIAHYEVWECLVFILPFSTWAITNLNHHRPRGFANFNDWLPLVIVIPIFMIIRGISGGRRRKRLISIALLIGLCLIALWSDFYFPADYRVII